MMLNIQRPMCMGQMWMEALPPIQQSNSQMKWMADLAPWTAYNNRLLVLASLMKPAYPQISFLFETLIHWIGPSESSPGTSQTKMLLPWQGGGHVDHILYGAWHGWSSWEWSRPSPWHYCYLHLSYCSFDRYRSIINALNLNLKGIFGSCSPCLVLPVSSPRPSLQLIRLPRRVHGGCTRHDTAPPQRPRRRHVDRCVRPCPALHAFWRTVPAGCAHCCRTWHCTLGSMPPWSWRRSELDQLKMNSRPPDGRTRTRTDWMVQPATV